MKKLPRYLLLALTLVLTACGKPDQPTIGLYLAIQRGDLDQIERHIAWGADINKKNVDGRRPLHEAAARGRHAITRLLIDNGADINARDQSDHTPLYSAIMGGRTQVAQLLVKRGAESDPDRLLDQLVESRVSDRDAIALLIRWGADINHLDNRGRTPLIQAISGGDRVLIKLLINKGADVNKPDGSGKRPLDLAVSLNDADIIRLLVKNGAEKEHGS